jgi:hypothetical protein
MNARFQAHQIVLLIEFASTELHTTLSARAVARAGSLPFSSEVRAASGL